MQRRLLLGSLVFAVALAAGAVAQREKVGQVKLADHRKVFGRSLCHGEAIYDGVRQMSRRRHSDAQSV